MVKRQLEEWKHVVEWGIAKKKVSNSRKTKKDIENNLITVYVHKLDS